MTKDAGRGDLKGGPERRVEDIYEHADHGAQYRHMLENEVRRLREALKEWKSAGLQARDDLRDIEREFREATPPGEDGPNPPIRPGQTFAEWTRPANTMRWIKELECYDD